VGRSRGGLSTKIHMTSDALGRPVRFCLTAGQVNDATQADHLLEEIETNYVIADRGYDSERVLEKIEELGAVAVIPPRSNRKEQSDYDRQLYKERNLIERAFNNKTLPAHRHPLREESRVLPLISIPGRFSNVDLI
jgi:transposase